MFNRILCGALVGSSILVVAGTPQARQGVSTSPPTATEITALIGSDADAEAVMSAALAFPPGSRPRKEFVLASQIREDWIPQVEGVEIVRVSDAEAASLLLACGTYWVITVRRDLNARHAAANGSMLVSRRQQCSASVSETEFVLRGGQWRAVGGGLGSGWVGGPPPECVRCLQR
jgi:hypothetical protein